MADEEIRVGDWIRSLFSQLATPYYTLSSYVKTLPKAAQVKLIWAFTVDMNLSSCTFCFASDWFVMIQNAVAKAVLSARQCLLLRSVFAIVVHGSSIGKASAPPICVGSDNSYHQSCAVHCSRSYMKVILHVWSGLSTWSERWQRYADTCIHACTHAHMHACTRTSTRKHIYSHGNIWRWFQSTFSIFPRPCSCLAYA